MICVWEGLVSGGVFAHRIEDIALYNGSAIRFHITTSDNTTMPRIFHPLLALIASATDRELAKYVDYLKEESKILRARIPGEIHTKPYERERLLKFGEVIGKRADDYTL